MSNRGLTWILVSLFTLTLGGVAQDDLVEGARELGEVNTETTFSEDALYEVPTVEQRMMGVGLDRKDPTKFDAPFPDSILDAGENQPVVEANSVDLENLNAMAQVFDPLDEEGTPWFEGLSIWVKLLFVLAFISVFVLLWRLAKATPPEEKAVTSRKRQSPDRF